MMKQVKKVSISVLIIVAAVAAALISIMFAIPAIRGGIFAKMATEPFHLLDNSGVSYEVCKNKDVSFYTAGDNGAGNFYKAKVMEITFSKMTIVETYDEEQEETVEVPVMEVAGRIYEFSSDAEAKYVYDKIVRGINEMNIFSLMYKPYVIVCVKDNIYFIYKGSNEKLAKKILPWGKKYVYGEYDLGYAIDESIMNDRGYDNIRLLYADLISSLPDVFV